jgi:hypothetical protein
MVTGARISLTKEPKQDTAFDSQSEVNRFVKEDIFTCNNIYFKKIRHFSENGTLKYRKTAVSKEFTVRVIWSPDDPYFTYQFQKKPYYNRNIFGPLKFRYRQGLLYLVWNSGVLTFQYHSWLI